MSKIYIAGAHSRGITTGYYLKYLNPSIEIIAYLYDDDDDNPSEVDGVPVLKIHKKSRLDKSAAVYIGTRQLNVAHITKTLQSCGMTHIIPVDAALDMDLRNRFLQKYFHKNNRAYEKLYDYETKSDELLQPSAPSHTIYVANSIYDKALKSEYNLQSYERIIQVGAALTDERFGASIFDDTGDNISARNRQFCELTALYWIWRNAREDIVGLAHYRRHFILPSNWALIMEQSNIDVILPVPLYVHPNLEENYCGRHVKENWDNMLELLKMRDETEYKAASHFFKTTGIYSPCNMIIARKEAFDKLCHWLFPIIFSVADKGGILDDNYQNRYPGFLSERLITYFFEKNKDRFKVVYADKNFLE